MDSTHLPNEEFLTRLGELFSGRQGKTGGSIFLVQKRLTYNQNVPKPTEKNPLPDLNLEKPLPILIRATNGKSSAKRADKIKLATLVAPDDLEAFYSRYADVCKAGMVALKPRDRSKKKAKAKKKKSAATGTS
ncbi:hypothetical protein jhhlp_005671 [Lomentospora prolificans]|uniref:Signal recognition particle subunit SRP14 n=1 Tax=Lomentospora prolificans TaxID=41688 RepID=A0A2N3N3T5_9PEZI|nr:hypothetical protein jhhlp_005671 [Lomentospora prolificans]